MNNAIERTKGQNLPDPEVQQLPKEPREKIILDERGMIDMPFLLLTYKKTRTH